MDLTHVYATVWSGVVRIVFELNGVDINAGTGFVLRGYLVTNHHVFSVPQADWVRMEFAPSTFKKIEPIRMIQADWAQAIKTGSGESEKDFAILDIPRLRSAEIHSFEFERSCCPARGLEYIAMGYPLEVTNLTFHKCMVSSLHIKNDQQVIQVDGSINNGNSGGPLIDPRSLGVIGIVTRKNIGLSKTFIGIRPALKESIKVVREVEAAAADDVTKKLTGVILEMQQHLNTLSAQLERSANSGVAYAFDIESIYCALRYLETGK